MKQGDVIWIRRFFPDTDLNSSAYLWTLVSLDTDPEGDTEVIDLVYFHKNTSQLFLSHVLVGLFPPPLLLRAAGRATARAWWSWTPPVPPGLWPTSGRSGSRPGRSRS